MTFLQALLSRWNVIPGFLIELTTEVAALPQLLVRLFLGLIKSLISFLEKTSSLLIALGFNSKRF